MNITLLFSVEAYERVMEAYIRGLERRHEEGGSLDVASVASFFVSRVDTEVDKRLEALGRPELRGTAAVANARAAYRRFGEVFGGERFAALRGAGCPVQRPLWASTGVKDPHYPETKYVATLVGRHTVNTMPMPTLLACKDQLEVTAGTAELDPGAELEALAEAGIDLKDVTETLLRDGIEKFVEPFDRLLESIELTREGIVTERPKTIGSSIPDDLERPLAERVEQAESEGVARRVWQRDQALWGGPGLAEIDNRLGWLTISEKMLEHAGELTAFASECRDAGLTDAVLLGMGGSSLGPEVIRRSYGEIPDALRLHVLDSTDPGAVLSVERSVDLETTLFIVSSKSGGTIETLSHMRYFFERNGREGSRFVAITDPGSPLVDLARERGFLRVFENDPDIGGRYSVLSYFGLVPAALAGVNIEAMLHRAQVAEQNCAAFGAAAANSGLWLGVLMGQLAQQGRDKLTFVVSEPIGSFGLWVEQLIAESTGKQGKGILPVAGEPLGEPAVYGDDRVFAYLRNPEQPDEQQEERHAGARAGRPPDGHPGGARRRRPRPHLLLLRVRHGRGGLGPGHQPLRPAQRAGGKGQHGARARRGPARAGPGRPRRAARPSGSAPLRRDHGLRRADAGVRRCGRGAPGEDPRADTGDHDLRLRAALPALDRADAQGGTAHGALPAARARRRGGRGDPRGRLHIRAPEDGSGRR